MSEISSSSIHISKLPCKYGIYYVKDDLPFEGYMVIDYSSMLPEKRRILMSLLQLNKVPVPDKGGIIIDTKGNIFAIPETVQDFIPMEIKPILKETFEKYKYNLEQAIQEQRSIELKIESYNAEISKLRKSQKQATKQNMANLDIIQADIIAFSNNAILLDQLADAIKNKEPITRIDRKPNIVVKDDAIHIISAAKIFIANTTEAKMLETIHNFYSLDLTIYPKIDGKYIIEVEDSVSWTLSSSGAKLYTYTLKVHCPNKLTSDSVDEVVKVLEDVGVAFKEEIK